MFLLPDNLYRLLLLVFALPMLPTIMIVDRSLLVKYLRNWGSGCSKGVRVWRR